MEYNTGYIDSRRFKMLCCVFLTHIHETPHQSTVTPSVSCTHKQASLTRPWTGWPQTSPSLQRHLFLLFPFATSLHRDAPVHLKLHTTNQVLSLICAVSKCFHLFSHCSHDFCSDLHSSLDHSPPNSSGWSTAHVPMSKRSECRSLYRHRNKLYLPWKPFKLVTFLCKNKPAFFIYNSEAFPFRRHISNWTALFLLYPSNYTEAVIAHKFGLKPF